MQEIHSTKATEKNVLSISGEETCHLVMESRIAQESVFALDII